MGYFKELNIIEIQSIEEKDSEFQLLQLTLGSTVSSEIVKSNFDFDLDNVVILADVIQPSNQYLQFVSEN